MQWHASRQVANADDFHPVAVGHLVQDRAFDIAAGLNRKVHNHASGLHRVEHFGGDENRRPASKHLRGGDDDVGVPAGFFHRVPLLLDLFLGQRLRVAILGLAGFAEVNFEKLRAERLDLLLHDGPRVVGGDLCAESFGGGNCLQTGDADADDENFRRQDRSRCRGHHRKNLVGITRCEDDRLVSTEVGLR